MSNISLSNEEIKKMHTQFLIDYAALKNGTYESKKSPKNNNQNNQNNQNKENKENNNNNNYYCDPSTMYYCSYSDSCSDSCSTPNSQVFSCSTTGATSHALFG